MESAKPHLWHRLEATALLLTVVIVPLVLWWTTTGNDREKARIEYVRLAINILEPPSKDMQPDLELREWAVDVLQNSSPVKLSESAKASLIDGTSTLPIDSTNGMRIAEDELAWEDLKDLSGLNEPKMRPQRRRALELMLKGREKEEEDKRKPLPNIDSTAPPTPPPKN